MKRIPILLLFSFLTTFVFSQEFKNVNPDPNGEPWIIGGLELPSEDLIKSIPQLEIGTQFKTKDLPSSLDNSTSSFFRPIFSQTDGSCGQASGIGYNFTYEINRARNISSSATENQYPTHYTYNFLNRGSGSNGSWYGDGWNIIKANGCPNVNTYGGLYQAANYWMTDYDKYESGMDNRVVSIFNIDVSTPEGLETLKYWMYNHGDGSETGGIVNFAAGINVDEYYMTYNNIITKWGYTANHAMTFVGWDDDIEYDFNNDGQITNDIDITGDGNVDMKDWEKGALIMVNSWGNYWGDNGKAYVMYKLLATPVSEGGIAASNMVSSIFVRPTYTPSAIMKVEMTHNVRNKIKIRAGVSPNLTSEKPDYYLDFPLFNYQGGEYSMIGTSSSPIEFSLDITPLLSYINSDVQARFFIEVVEQDEYSTGSGTINSFSIKNSYGAEYTSNQTNVTINDNDTTNLWVDAQFSFESPEITTTNLENASYNEYYEHQMLASGGESPYSWGIKVDYYQTDLSESFPNITTNELEPDNYDDGYAAQELEFDFPFYDNFYETVYVRTDGSIVFSPGFDYLRTEDAIKQNRVISVFASDLMIYPDQGDGIFYEGNSDYATFRWKTSLFDQPDVDVDVAVTIYPSGNMKFYYGNTTEGLSWASGISNGDDINFLITDFSGLNNPSDNQLKIETSGFPKGMSISEDGVFSGFPSAIGTWELNFIVTDYNNIFEIKTITFTSEYSSYFEDISDKVNLFPNPIYDFLNIKILDTSINDLDLQIVDSKGNICKKYSLKTDNNILLNLSDLQQGIYFIEINTGDEFYHKKFVIKR